MSSLITNGIKVSVKTEYIPQLSNPDASKYIHYYHITIENHTSNSVKLLRRKWFIFDSLDVPRIISGIGVIGEQPELEPGETYNYTSSCDLRGSIGYMEGNYDFVNTITGEQYSVKIPRFTLTSIVALN